MKFILFLAGLASCAPSGQPETFSLQQVKNENAHGLYGPTALVNAFSKYGKPMPEAMRKARLMNPELDQRFRNRMAVGTKTTSVPAYPAPYYDVQYVVPVKIGTPPQTTYMNLDTGSADFWVFSTDTYKPQVRGHTLYRPKDSKTSKRLDGQSWSVLYGDGSSASGTVYRDRVVLGGTSFNTQAVQSAVQVSPAISGDNFASGILGLGKTRANTIRPNRQKTYFENIQSSLRQPLFTADLKAQQRGSYDFGYIDSKKYTGGIKYTNVDPNSPYWEFTVDGYKVGKASNGVSRYRFQAIADTGTTLLLLPQSIVNNYYSKIKGAKFDSYNGMMVFPCSTNPPDFTIVLGSYRGVVPGHYINYGPADRTNCYGGIQSSDGIGFAIFGDVLLKAQFAVFDSGRGRIGFANKKTVPRS